MTTETSQEEVVVPETNEGEVEQEVDTISLRKSEYEKLNQDLGSLKRELKDLRKIKEDTKETPKSNTQPDNRLLERLEKSVLRQHNISHPDDVDLARNTAKKWGMDLEDVLVDDDFKAKLDRQQTARDNIAATSNVKGGAGSNQAKNSPEYWIAKGIPPSASEVPDRKTRANIARAMMASAKSSKKFYND